MLAADIAGVERLLDKCPVQLRHWEWGRLKRLCHLDLLTLQGHDSKVTSVAFSLDGRRIASGSVDETIKVWDAMVDGLTQDEAVDSTADR